MLRKALILSLVFLSSDVAYAGDEEESDRKVVYKQKTEIDFEGLEVEGVLQKPQSALILERKQASFNPLIKLRTDWKDQMERSVDEIK
jgi:hypothetical protein